MAFMWTFLLFVAIFATYAITSAKRRVARGGTWEHPKALKSFYISSNSWGSIVLTDGSTYQVAAGNDASGWQPGDEVYFDGGRLYNRTRFDNVVAARR